MKIAIVGSHPETWHLAPFDDPTWTIWAFSRRNYNKLPRCDLWFELHSPKCFPSYEINIPGYVDWLTSNPKRMTHPIFPKDALVERFGPYFFTDGQAPWMLAYAITQEPEKIGIWGIEAAGPYQAQRSEIRHFVQVARDQGIEVTAPAESELLEPKPIYAFS